MKTKPVILTAEDRGNHLPRVDVHLQNFALFEDGSVTCRLSDNHGGDCIIRMDAESWARVSANVRSWEERGGR